MSSPLAQPGSPGTNFDIISAIYKMILSVLTWFLFIFSNKACCVVRWAAIRVSTPWPRLREVWSGMKIVCKYTVPIVWLLVKLFFAVWLDATIRLENFTWIQTEIAMAPPTALLLMAARRLVSLSNNISVSSCNIFFVFLRSRQFGFSLCWGSG